MIDLRAPGIWAQQVPPQPVPGGVPIPPVPDPDGVPNPVGDPSEPVPPVGYPDEDETVPGPDVPSPIVAYRRSSSPNARVAAMRQACRRQAEPRP